MDEFINHLQKMRKAIEDMEGEHSYPVSEIMTDRFISLETSMGTFGEFLQAGGWKEEDLAGIPNDELDAYVVDSTRFESWQEMVDDAGKAYLDGKFREKVFGHKTS